MERTKYNQMLFMQIMNNALFLRNNKSLTAEQSLGFINQHYIMMGFYIKEGGEFFDPETYMVFEDGAYKVNYKD